MTTAWTKDTKTTDTPEIVGKNHQIEAFADIHFNLKTRKKQFEKFLLVIIDDENLSLKFDKAYRDGIKRSKEPLYQAYRELRKAAEPTEEEALDSVISKMLDLHSDKWTDKFAEREEKENLKRKKNEAKLVRQNEPSVRITKQNKTMVSILSR